MTKAHLWSYDKNEWLKKERGVSFEELLASRFIRIERHARKLNQRLMLFEFQKYVWVVPYVEDKEHYFLKTAFPSRKHTKEYLKGG